MLNPLLIDRVNPYAMHCYLSMRLSVFCDIIFMILQTRGMINMTEIFACKSQKSLFVDKLNL